jgi:hypothetical protein
MRKKTSADLGWGFILKNLEMMFNVLQIASRPVGAYIYPEMQLLQISTQNEIIYVL